MSTPDTTVASAAGNTDAPTAVVKTLGPTEIIGLLVTVGGILASLFGKDWGISEHAEAIVSMGYLVGPAVIGFARAIKHHGAAHANANVYVAQLQAALAATAHHDPGVTPETVAAGVSALNGATPQSAGDTPDLDAIPEDLPADEQPPPQ